MLTREERIKIRKDNRFKRTNSLWNEFRFNQAWTIGYLNNLCKISNANTFEEWEKFYISSGDERRRLIGKLPALKQYLLLNFEYKTYFKLEPKEKELNTMMGRNLEDMRDIAVRFHKIIVDNKIKNVSLDLCFAFVYIRILDETWIGRNREINTISLLSKTFPVCDFIETSLHDDVKLAIDYEVKVDGVLICGVQVKSDVNYKKIKQGNANAISTIQSNYSRNKNYILRNKVDVLYVYSTENGTVVNREVISKIECLINKVIIA